MYAGRSKKKAAFLALRSVTTQASLRL